MEWGVRGPHNYVQKSLLTEVMFEFELNATVDNFSLIWPYETVIPRYYSRKRYIVRHIHIQIYRVYNPFPYAAL